MTLSNASSSSDSSIPAYTVKAGQAPSPSNGPRGFVDRRRSRSTDPNRPERRQFGSSHAGLSAAGRELALAIDQYKIENHRRYLTCDEILRVLMQLGYSRQG